MSSAKHSMEVPPLVGLTQMTIGSWVTQGLYIAAKLGVADRLNEKPQSCGELAAAVGAHADSLYRVMRALASVGVFCERGGRFHPTPLSEHLRNDARGSLRSWALLAGESFHWNLWEELGQAVKTGEPVWDQVHGMGPIAFFDKNPEAAETFDVAMSDFSAPEIPALIDAYDFTAHHTIVAVGGNQGTFVAEILKSYRNANAILFDLPPVIARAHALIQKQMLAHRCQLVGGDFLQSIPSGGDLYIFKRVLQNWHDDNGAVTMLRNCHAAMQGQGKLLVIETVIPPGNEPFFGKWLDLLMLLIGGKNRTEVEYRELYRASGFELTRIIPTATPVSIIEGVCV